MSEETMIIEEHSVKELFDTIYEIRRQTTKTNGRVNVLEKASVGLWVSNHKIKTLCLILSMLGFLVSDIRQPVLLFLAQRFGGLK